eukprot:Rhum_TRINITY_DN20925_c0_g1::Rhum_TRINITY_DN20925_c0_g1_i1::g.172518::m.172518
MAQYGRRMRLQRLYEDGDGAEQPYASPGQIPGYVPSMTEVGAAGSQYTIPQKDFRGDAAANRGAAAKVDDMMDTLHKRLKLLEDKSLMVDTTHRRVVMEGEGLKRRLQEVEHDTHKTIADLTTGVERSLRGISESKRDVESAREWAQTYVASQLQQHEQMLRNTYGGELTAVSNRTKQLQESVGNNLQRFEGSLQLCQEASKNFSSEQYEKHALRIHTLEGMLNETLNKAEMMEQHFADSLDVAISRERNARERDALEKDRVMQQLSTACSAAVEREIGAEIKKTNEFADTSLQRMDAIERLLKAEIRNRIDLSTSHDRLVEDVRKVERNTLASIAQIETSVQEKHAELHAAVTQQGAAQREALHAVSEAQKKAMTSLQTTLQSETQEVRSFLLGKIEANAQTLNALTQQVHQNGVRGDETDRILQELRAQQDRDGKEVRSMLTRSENKVREDLSNMSASLQEICTKQLHTSIKEAVLREREVKEECMAETKRAMDELLLVKKLSEKDTQDLRKLVHEKNQETQEEVKGNLDRVTTLLHKTDEISRLQLDRNHEFKMEISDTQRQVEECTESLGRKVADLVAAEAAHKEDSEGKARDIADLKAELKGHRDDFMDTLTKKAKDMVDVEKRRREELAAEVADLAKKSYKRAEEAQDRVQSVADDVSESERQLKRLLDSAVQRSIEEEAATRQEIASLKDSLAIVQEDVSDMTNREQRTGSDARKDLLLISGQIEDLSEREQRATEALKSAVGEVRKLSESNRQDVADQKKELQVLLTRVQLNEVQKEADDETLAKREKYAKEELQMVSSLVTGVTESIAKIEAKLVQDEDADHQKGTAVKREHAALIERLNNVQEAVAENRTEMTKRLADLSDELETRTNDRVLKSENRGTKRTQTLEESIAQCRQDLDLSLKKDFPELLAGMDSLKTTFHHRCEKLENKVEAAGAHSTDEIEQATANLRERVATLEKNLSQDAKEGATSASVEALKLDVAELRNEMATKTIFRSELDLVTNKLVSVDTDNKEMQRSIESVRTEISTQLQQMVGKEQERSESDALWDEWRDALTGEVGLYKKNLIVLVESHAHIDRRGVEDDEATMRRAMQIEMDLSRTDMDIDAYEKLLERFHERETDAIQKRLDGPSNTEPE